MTETVMLIFTNLIYIGEGFFDLYVMSFLFKRWMRWRGMLLTVLALIILPRILTDAFIGVGTTASYIILNILYFAARLLPFRGKFWKRLGMVLVLFFIELLGEMGTREICLRHQIDFMRQGHFYAAILAYGIYNMLMMFVIWIIFIGKKWTKRISLFLLFPFYQIFNLWLYWMLRDAPLWNQTVVGFIVAFCNLWLVNTVIHVFQGMMERIETEEHLDMLQRQREYELQYYRNVERRIEELRDIRHDYLNQIQTSLLLLEAGRQDAVIQNQQDLASLVRQSQEKLDGYRKGIWCENPVVDALLSLKSEEARRRGIRFDACCELDRELPLDNIELCCVFGNLLDNALEANTAAGDERMADWNREYARETNAARDGLEKSDGEGYELEETGGRYIRIKAQKLSGQLVVKCENSAARKPREKNGRWVSEKKNSENHGRGLHVVEQICKKYNGRLEKKYENQKVVITVVV